MARTASPLTLASAAGTGVGLTIFGVLAFGGAGHAETLVTKPLPAMVALQDRAPALPAVGATRRAVDHGAGPLRARGAGGLPGPYAQR